VSLRLCHLRLATTALHVTNSHCFQDLILNYLTNIAFYLCLKASGIPNIRDHPVISSLVDLRTSIEKAEAIEKKLGMQKQIDSLTKQFNELASSKKKDAKKTNGKVATKATKKKGTKIPVQVEEAVESDIEEEDHIEVPMIEEEFRSMKKAAKAAKKRKRMNEEDDFHDLDALDSVDIEDKAAKKRSLRDYASKIDSVSVAFSSAFLCSLV
jgi:U3 small nucleolar RNA-associated protein 3